MKLLRSFSYRRSQRPFNAVDQQTPELRVLKIIWMAEGCIKNRRLLWAIQAGPRYRLGSLAGNSAQQQRRSGWSQRADLIERAVAFQFCDLNTIKNRTFNA